MGGRDITGWRVKMSEMLVLEFEGFGRNVYEPESREAQAAFMENRLGAALQAGGVTGPPSRMEWLSDPSHHLVG
jgi:hypothetical protein